MSENGARKWIDFEDLKKTASVEAVLSALDLLDGLVRTGVEWKGQCPFHKGEGSAKPFCFHEEKRAFHCFACKRKGNVLDFVKMYLEWKNKGKMGVREAAEFIDTAMAGYTPIERVESEEEAASRAVLEQEAEQKPKEKKGGRAAKNEVREEDSQPVMSPSWNPEYFLDFIEACRAVSLGHETARDFVAVRVSFLQKLRGLFFTGEDG